MPRKLQPLAAAWTRVAGSEAAGDLVEFHMHPADSFQFDLAVERAKKVMRQIAEHDELAQEYGLSAFSMQEDLAGDEGAILGMSTALIATELAMEIATEFRGYIDQDDRPFPWTRRHVFHAMRDWDGEKSVAQRFLDRALVSVFRVQKEEKPFAGAPNGTGAPAINTAPDAGS